MVKHTETIRRQKPTNCLSMLGHFMGLALQGLRGKEGEKWGVTNVLIKKINRTVSHRKKIFMKENKFLRLIMSTS